MRFPATNGQEIVFSYAGDLYKVAMAGGEAHRLTSHVGYEMFPRFSPDGRTIAFTGQYDGNTEVYVMPATGGEPLRVTYTATNSRDDLGDRMGPNNIVMGWTTDGQRIIYRNRIGSGFEGRLLTVDKEGGLSAPIPLPEGGFCSYSPDGKRLVLVFVNTGFEREEVRLTLPKAMQKQVRKISLYRTDERTDLSLVETLDGASRSLSIAPRSLTTCVVELGF